MPSIVLMNLGARWILQSSFGLASRLAPKDRLSFLVTKNGAKYEVLLTLSPAFISIRVTEMRARRCVRKAILTLVPITPSLKRIEEDFSLGWARMVSM